MTAKGDKPKRPPGRPVTTGSSAARPVFWRPSAAERARLEQEAASAGCTVNELSRRRTLDV